MSMIKAIRKLDFGWIIISMGFIMILSGFSMIFKYENGKTWLCEGARCKLVQGYSLVVLSIFIIVIGIVNLLRK